MIPKQLQLKNTIKYPTSIIIGGLNRLGFEIADSLIKQGGYVVIVDAVTPENIQKFDVFPDSAMISFLDYTSIPHLEEDIRRLDYVFYFNHSSSDFRGQISTQEFLTVSNYLDAALSLASKFEARFLLTTSIKANQILFAEDNTAYNLSMSKQYTQVYTNMEIQRYSEGLVMEYHEKAGLNTRIIRLGEIIGDGMDFRHDSVFVQLVIDAVNGRALHLTSDGLEHEWYVHTLDAAYGIIKAQFAKDTEGKVFSVSYENTYTHLSVAYKIQELEDRAGEIKFIEGKDTSPPVRIYKPAPNLTKIGWMHRISFDRGVVQSIAAAKIALLEEGANNIDNEDSGKLKNFLSLARSSSSMKNLSKSEQEEYIKKERLSQAYGSIKSKRKQRQKRLPERIRDIFWKVFTSLAGVFSFLKRMSPVEFGIFTLVMIVFIVTYILVLSPILFIVRHTLSISPEYNKVQAYIEAGDYENLYDSANDIESSIRSIQTSIDKLGFAAKVVSYSEELDRINSMLDYYRLYAEGIKNMSYGIEPFNSYLDAFVNNTQTRNSTEGFLSTTNSGLNLQTLLTEIKNREIYFDKGVEQYNRAIDAIRNNELPEIPKVFADKLNTINNDIIDTQTDLVKYLQVYKVMPEILGYNRPVTYLLLALDNTRLTPIGGDISAYAVLTVQNGSVSDVNVQTTDNLTIPASTVTEEMLRQVNARRFSYKNAGTIKIENISTVDDPDTFGILSRDLWSGLTNISIDNTLVLTLESFEQMFGSFVDSNEYTVNGVNFANGSILQNLSQSLEANESVTAKRNIIAQLFSLMINQGLSHWKDSHRSIESTISAGLDNNNIAVIESISAIDELIADTKTDLSRLYKTDTYLSAAVTMEDPKVVLVDRFPDISLSLETTIDEFYNIDNTLTLTFPVTGSSREISVCLPDKIRLGSISIDESTIPQARTRINIAGNSVCVVAQALTESQFRFSWRTDSLWAPESENVTISLGVGSIRGARTELDHTIRVPRGMGLTVNGNPIAESSYGVKYQIQADEVINIELSK